MNQAHQPQPGNKIKMPSHNTILVWTTWETQTFILIMLNQIMDSKSINSLLKMSLSEDILISTLNLPTLPNNRTNIINTTNPWDPHLTIRIQQFNHLMRVRVMFITKTLSLNILALTNKETTIHTDITILKVSTTFTLVIDKIKTTH